MEKERAIPFILYDDDRGKFTLGKEAETFLSGLSGKIGIIAIVGKYRTGKSFLINRVLLNRQGQNGFRVGPTINPCTKGLWVWNQLIKASELHCGGINPGEAALHEDLSFVVIDCEGFGGFDESSNQDSRIFLFALLLSSCLIYNSVGNIDEQALQGISVIVNLAKEVKLRTTSNVSFNVSGSPFVSAFDDKNDIDNIGQHFPSLLWVIRDFSLKLADQIGNPITAKEYLENALAAQKGVSDVVESKNRIRRLIKHFFQDRDCWTLIRPLESEKELQRLDDIPDESLRPEFVEQIKGLKRKLHRKLKPKVSFDGRNLNGQMLVELSRKYLEVVNEGSVPVIENIWVYVSRQETQKGYENALSWLDTKMKGYLSGNWDTLKHIGDLKKMKTALRMEIVEMFRASAVVSEKEVVKMCDDLVKEFGTKYALFREEIRGKIELESANFLKKRIEELSKQLQEGSFTNIEQFQLMWRSFRKEFMSAEDDFTISLRSRLLHDASDELYNEASNYFIKEHEKLLQNRLNASQDERKLLENELAEIKKNIKEKQEKKDASLQTEAVMMIEVSVSGVNTPKEDSLAGSSIQENKPASRSRLMMPIPVAKRSHAVSQDEEGFAAGFASQGGKSVIADGDHSEWDAQRRVAGVMRVEYEGKIRELERELEGYQEQGKEMHAWRHEKSYLENEIAFLKGQLEENNRLHEALLTAVQRTILAWSRVCNVNDIEGKTQHELESRKEMKEMNQNLASVFEQIEGRCKELEIENDDLRTWKETIVNYSLGIVCKECSKSVTAPNFSQHQVSCGQPPRKATATSITATVTSGGSGVNGSNSSNQRASISLRKKISYQIKSAVVPKARESVPASLSYASHSHNVPGGSSCKRVLQIYVNQVLIKGENNEIRPHTEYLIQLAYGTECGEQLNKWCVTRKFKAFYQLHQSIASTLAGLKLSPSTTAWTSYLIGGLQSKLPTEELRKALQTYLTDLSRLSGVQRSKTFREFLEIDRHVCIEEYLQDSLLNEEEITPQVGEHQRGKSSLAADDLKLRSEISIDMPTGLVRKTRLSMRPLEEKPTLSPSPAANMALGGTATVMSLTAGSQKYSSVSGGKKENLQGRSQSPFVNGIRGGSPTFISRFEIRDFGK